MPGAPEEDKRLAHFARDLLGGAEGDTVHPVYNESETHFVHVLTCPDAPRPGTTTVSTFSLHLFPNLVGGTDVSTELVMMANTDDPNLKLLIGSAALNVAADSWPL